MQQRILSSLGGKDTLQRATRYRFIREEHQGLTFAMRVDERSEVEVSIYERTPASCNIVLTTPFGWNRYYKTFYERINYDDLIDFMEYQLGILFS